MFDIIIKNGTIIDGTGQSMFLGDIGIKEKKINSIGDLQNEKAEKIIDARGRYVAPGFIDINNHSDTYWRIFPDPDLESLIYQGVTTILGGNCGSSLAPLVNKNIIQSIQKWTDIRGLNLNWLKVGEFLQEVEKKKLSVNFATLVGHGTLRRGFVGDEARSLTLEEIGAMKKMLKNAMKEGSFGLSTGLVYTHGKLASENEIEELAGTVKDCGGVYVTHIRGEGKELLKSVKEAIRIAQTTKVKLQISHLKAMGKKNWRLMQKAIDLVEEAKVKGIDVSFDIYPYTETGSVLYTLLPDWVAEGGKKMMIHRLKDRETRFKVINEMQEDGFDYSKVIISISPLNRILSRKKIVDIAEAQGKSVEETIIEILIAGEGRVVTIMDVLSKENVIKGIQSPYSMIASNGSGYNLNHRNSGELVHPRNFGTFPRLLGQYVREQKILTWEEAIKKISGLPAEKFGFKKRGTIAKGNFADIAIFDPEKIDDLATVENPYQYSEGISWVLVNGKVILENGKYNGVRAGEVLRKDSRFLGL